MTGDELIALEHENWIAYLTGVVSCASQATVTHTAGVVTILTGLPFDWFNQVLVEHEEATRDGVLAGVARAREQGDPFVVRLRDGIDDRFVRTLADAGLEPAMEPSTPGMVAFPIDHAIARHAAPELEIRRVTDATGIDVVADGVDADCGVATLQASEIGRPIYERQGFRTVVRYVAYVERTGPREPIGRAAT